jgi:hypothetical protein
MILNPRRKIDRIFEIAGQEKGNPWQTPHPDWHSFLDAAHTPHDAHPLTAPER